MAITASAANFDRDLETGQISHTLVLPVSVPANALIVYGNQDRTGGVNYTAVSDNLNGAHSIVNQTLPVASNSVTNALMTYFRPAAAGATTITTTTSGAVNSQACGGFITGAASLSVTQDTAQATGTGTTFTSNNITIANGSSGGILAFLKCNNSQASVPSALNAGAINLNDAADAGSRCFMLYMPYSGNGSYGFTGTLAASATWCIETIAVQEGGGGPAITTVDGDNSVELEKVPFNIVGTDFDNTVPKATAEIRQGSFTYALDIGSQDATTITAEMPDNLTGGAGPVPGAGTIAVINDDDLEDTQAVTFLDATDTYAIEVGTPNADADLRVVASADAVAGDWARVMNVIGGTIANVTLNDDLTWSADEDVESFDVQFWDQSDGNWGTPATQSTSVEASIATRAIRNFRRAVSRGFFNMGRGRG
jgi:hypothetical protein